MEKTIVTKWVKRVYDVWGNASEGYDVNDSFYDGTVEIRLKVNEYDGFKDGKTNWTSAFPSDYQLGKIFGFTGKLDVSGDDINIYVNRESDGYPLGELHCVSHVFLSPIREVE